MSGSLANGGRLREASFVVTGRGRRTRRTGTRGRGTIATGTGTRTRHGSVRIRGGTGSRQDTTLSDRVTSGRGGHSTVHEGVISNVLSDINDLINVNGATALRVRCGLLTRRCSHLGGTFEPAIVGRIRGRAGRLTLRGRGTRTRHSGIVTRDYSVTSRHSGTVGRLGDLGRGIRLHVGGTIELTGTRGSGAVDQLRNRLGSHGLIFTVVTSVLCTTDRMFGHTVSTVVRCDASGCGSVFNDSRTTSVGDIVRDCNGAGRRRRAVKE